MEESNEKVATEIINDLLRSDDDVDVNQNTNDDGQKNVYVNDSELNDGEPAEHDQRNGGVDAVGDNNNSREVDPLTHCPAPQRHPERERRQTQWYHGAKASTKFSPNSEDDLPRNLSEAMSSEEKEQ